MLRIIAVAFSVAFAGLSHAQGIATGSEWVNDGGSEMKISTINSDGSISGTYINKADGFNCKNEPMALSGWLNGDLITFSVRWKNANVDCNSLTNWTGYYASGKIFTDWNLMFVSAQTGLPTRLSDSNVFNPK